MSVIYFLFIAELALTAFFSIKARRQVDPIKRGVYFARMNITIGILFLTLSFSQLFMSPFHYGYITFAILVLLIGLYNLFVGIRNHGMFTRMLKSD